MREYKHPDIDHVFMIKDISILEIEIDGFRVNRKDCDWMLMMGNHSGHSTLSMNDLAKPILQNILALKKNEKFTTYSRIV
jgi:hypothetical protein